MMEYRVENGIAYLNPELSELERRLFKGFEQKLIDKGFEYISIPSSVNWETIEKQGVIASQDSLQVDGTHCLSGSGEQGLLEYFSGQEVGPRLLFTENQCWRNEPELSGLKSLKEFRKLEQFAFVNPEDWQVTFIHLLHNAFQFFSQFDDLDIRIVDCTEQDPGYHHLKYDIEIKTEEYGWMETHSCSYFADEQVKRFGIRCGVHSISNTGIASPRVLIPFIEAGIGPNHPQIQEL